jgi:hypothetical protein
MPWVITAHFITFLAALQWFLRGRIIENGLKALIMHHKKTGLLHGNIPLFFMIRLNG